jgi:23S rRNA (adenine-N6)-dimethyltransferase
VTPGTLLVEIGGGTGVLTRALVESGAELVVIERDPALAELLRARFGRDAKVVCGDAVSFSWPRTPFSVVANLPFARSGAILAGLLRDPRVPLERADVIVQWEFAVKQSAVWPATQRATYWRAWYDLAVTQRLSRTCFAPVPSVDAAVLAIERRAEPRVPVDRHREYWTFLERAYRLNETMRRTVPSSRLKRLAPRLGFAPDSRARDLDAGQFASLFLAQG